MLAPPAGTTSLASLSRRTCRRLLSMDQWVCCDDQKPSDAQHGTFFETPFLPMDGAILVLSILTRANGCCRVNLNNNGSSDRPPARPASRFGGHIRNIIMHFLRGVPLVLDSLDSVALVAGSACMCRTHHKYHHPRDSCLSTQPSMGGVFLYGLGFIFVLFPRNWEGLGGFVFNPSPQH